MNYYVCANLMNRTNSAPMDFLSPSNVQMIWEVISDEERFHFLSKSAQQEIYQVFQSNLQGFYRAEGKGHNLVELNKKYMVLITGYIRRHFPEKPNKITIMEELPTVPSRESITFEEIQYDRRTQFEQELSKQQRDFDEMVQIKKPPVPEFADKYTDEPIRDMDALLKEMQAQRNYEIDQIRKPIEGETPPSPNAGEWLKSQTTSKKIQHDQKGNKDPLPSVERKVQFAEERNDYYEATPDDEEDANIFSKLKLKLENTSPPLPLTETTEDRLSRLERKIDELGSTLRTLLERTH